jgi:hypothetical protein
MYIYVHILAIYIRNIYTYEYIYKVYVTILKNKTKNIYFNIKDKIDMKSEIIKNNIIINKIKNISKINFEKIQILFKNKNISNSSSSGKVGEFSFLVLPDISPFLALFLTFLSIFPAMYVFIFNKKIKNRVNNNKKKNDNDDDENSNNDNKNENNRISSFLLLKCIRYVSLCSFMLGYHIHEKAVLISVICSGLIALESRR